MQHFLSLFFSLLKVVCTFSGLAFSELSNKIKKKFLYMYVREFSESTFSVCLKIAFQYYPPH